MLNIVSVTKEVSASDVSSMSSSSSNTSTASKKSCRVCKQPAHTYKQKDGSLGLANKVTMCPKFRNASDTEKGDIIKTEEKEHELCRICFYIGHSMANCKLVTKMSCDHCKQNHSSDACKF